MTLVTFDALRSAASSIWSQTPSSLSHQRRAPPQTAPPAPRTEVLRLGALVGELCASLLANAPPDPSREPLPPDADEEETFLPTLSGAGFWSKPSEAKDEVASKMGAVFLALFVTSIACGLDLKVCVLKKIELNNRKYPVELCKGKSGKYTAYSDQTGITKTDGQSTVDTDVESFTSSNDSGDDAGDDPTSCSAATTSATEQTDTVRGVTLRIRRFATDRSWSRYHTPRNIALALMGELGELAELFQWAGDGETGAPAGLAGWSEEDRDKAGQELADVTIYLMRMADVCGIDLGDAALATK